MKNMSQPLSSFDSQYAKMTLHFLETNRSVLNFRSTQKKLVETFDPLKAINLTSIFGIDDSEELSMSETVKKAVKHFQSVISAKNSQIQSLEPSEPEEEKAESENVQKRIVPWENLLEFEFEEEQSISKSKQRQSIIVVGSLLDNVPNIAGLARTCEIFKVQQLVIGNKRIEQDIHFQKMSVSAEKHLPIIEVKPKLLEGFLKEKKAEGFTIIAVEQTSKSISLERFEFPEKCVVLSGNEQQGLPAEFIAMVDVAIEIPQLGVIRSLNAHVCASIVIWEYTRQRIISK